MKLLDMNRCCAHRSWMGLAQRFRELLRAPSLLFTYLDFTHAIHITRQHGDERSAIFWEAARAHFIGVLGWHSRSASQLERILAVCQTRARDAHCLLFINRYLGEVYSVRDGCAERAFNYMGSAKRFAVEIGDAENIRQIEELLLDVTSATSAPETAPCL